MRRIGIVVGLADEARVLADTAGFVECCGPGPAGAGRAANRALESGATALLSFGIAGALNPILQTGSIVVATEIQRHGGKPFACDTAWLDRCVAALGVPSHGAIYGSDAVVGTLAEKRALFEATGAAAVDMESHIIAARAEAANIPFLAVRAIADAADQRAPVHLAACFDEHGEPRTGAIIAALLRHPSEILMLRGASRAYRAALAALGQAASAGGAALRDV